ncbi:unnamed protein product [Hymenolepis diminuta]|uniref:Intraflagellar transport protein 81 homolog n=1 Tax=Hymenolepis diminuta TaxID=6216 RepID=A0A0R3SM50_HYMDI|nr:unnamed protein product [Hymenolepis diminuta]
MSEVIKFITDKLTSPPFNRNFNYITFDELEPNLLLQLLSDVLGELDPKHKIDIRDEAPEATTMRILEALRMLRYKIPTEPDDLSELCESLIIGDKKCIYPIMESILQNFDEHKKRSYLSKFLTKVRVPADFMQDSELNKLYSEHEALIEAFKNTHKQLENIKHKSLSTCEVKNDISVMQEEKDQLLRRINRMKMKVENFPSSIMMLDVARKLRVERERKAKIAQQLQQQRIMVSGHRNLEDKVVELRQQSNEFQRRSADCNAENLLSRLEEEVKINQYLASEKQPKEINEAKAYLEDLTRIANQPALTYSYLSQLNQKVTSIISSSNFS